MRQPSDLVPDSLAAALCHAASCVARVMAGQSLAEGGLEETPGDLRPAVRDIVYGVLRRYGEGDALLSPLMKNPPYPEIRALLLCALYRLETWTDAHTVVDQAVEAAGKLADGRYKGLVNGVLRNYLRQQKALRLELEANPARAAARLWHPDWWLEKLKTAYPQDWQAIVAAGNTPPPMSLRVNCRRARPQDYLARLEAVGIAGEWRGRAGILLKRPVPVSQLPGFAEGEVSVQDLGAQRAAELLDPPPGSAVLDACAAPGGKTAHLLERNDLRLTALDIDPARCRLIEQNLSRLRLDAQKTRVRCGDASHPRAWGNAPASFDAILADVPCSASGVARRHPDIKWLRQPRDSLKFAGTQRRILERLWAALIPGGKLLYATCSVFPEENGEQVAKFLRRAPDARLEAEEQWLPQAEHDGFYYALLQKLT
jgi:16S rRNA (cytosine967-C5)-methyltransferase